MVAALVLANSLVHLHLVGEPRDTTNLLLFMVGAGFLLLSTRWLLACLAVTLAGWVLVATAHPPFDPWGRFLFALVSASVLSLLVHIVRLRTVIGFEQLRADLEGLVTERTRTLASERNLCGRWSTTCPTACSSENTAGRYRLANAAHRRQLGLGTSEELAHRTVIDMAPGDWARREAEPRTPRGHRERDTRSSIASSEIQLGIERVRIVTSKVRVSEPGGGVVGLVGVTRDVTTTGEAEKAAHRKKLRETQKLESLGLLAGGIAHDFNNLLTGILGHANLARRVHVPSRSKPASSRSSSRRSAPPSCAARCWPTPARAASRSGTSISAPRCTDHVADPRVDRADGPPRAADVDGPADVEGDLTQIRQIVMNLVLNGAEATEGKAGIIRVTTGVMDADAAYLASTHLSPDLPEGRYVFLEVADNGRGMSPDTLARIFDPFFRPSSPAAASAWPPCSASCAPTTAR